MPNGPPKSYRPDHDLIIRSSITVVPRKYSPNSKTAKSAHLPYAALQQEMMD